MPVMRLLLDIDRAGGFVATRELADKDASDAELADKVIHLADKTVLEVGTLEGGMSSGEASVAFCFPLPDGRVVIAETSARLFVAAARAIAARHGKVTGLAT